ncbi:hypothetical protein EVAR_78349_1 [Eumeta japonica]|uniref:Uncharacterized protein n=1 Tax=Eumeta variegata TaxID=151549 RepID=A0A4C1T3A4_EUMVA|nr:hypothetical protein EVAR_78349_1 [Eumeta japonica]
MKQRLLQLNLFLSEWKGRVPFTFMSVSLALRRANHARVEGTRALTRSHCERITAPNRFVSDRRRAAGDDEPQRASEARPREADVLKHENGRTKRKLYQQALKK